MLDLSIIKVAQEYATFQDYRIRDAINSLIKNLEADMDEVGFDPSPNTKKCIEDFENLVTEIETSRNPRPPRIEIQEDEIPVREIAPRVEEEESNIRNVDDELDEFVTEITKTKNHNKQP